MDYVGFSDSDWNKCYDTILKVINMSSAGIVIMPIQDILGYGSDTRLNTPGKADGNWGYRVTKEQLNSIDRSRFKKLNTMYGR